MNSLSQSMSSYLLQIYLLEIRFGEVHLRDVATAMGVSKPSASRAARLLTHEGFIAHERAMAP